MHDPIALAPEVVPALYENGARPLLTTCYPETLFGGFTRADGTIAFYSRVASLLTPASVVVDFGCGRGRAGEDPVPVRRRAQCLRGQAGRVIGMDIDPVGALNPVIDEFRRLDPDRAWPIGDNAAHLILCDQVMEHLPDPDTFFSEARRVLLPGGYLCIRTPNRWGYVALVSRLIPERFHSNLLSRAQPERRDHDVFPAHYRCNSVSALRRGFSRHGFRAAVYGWESEPSYLAFSRLAYAAGVLYQRFAPGAVRNVLFAFGQKLG